MEEKAMAVVSYRRVTVYSDSDWVEAYNQAGIQVMGPGLHTREEIYIWLISRQPLKYLCEVLAALLPLHHVVKQTLRQKHASERSLR